MKAPKLRTAQKVKPPFKQNNFPRQVIINIAKDIVYHLATKGEPRLEGPDWEKIFANAIGAEWKPSNVGLDDIVLGNCAWGAKTVKAKHPSKSETVRLISGRNSPVYSYNGKISAHIEPNGLGEKVIGIWNARVDSLYSKFKFLRTVVLIKSYDLCELCVFEFETVRYNPLKYSWRWNARNNLEGFDLNNRHIFTWQPHGSQFTIIETVPDNKTAFTIKNPDTISKDKILHDLGFDESWVTILKP